MRVPWFVLANGIPHYHWREPAAMLKRWHRSVKNQVPLENHYLPGELKARIGKFVDYYNTERYHESLNNPAP